MDLVCGEFFYNYTMAKKFEMYGHTFDSKLELAFYDLLVENDIDFTFHPDPILIQPSYETWAQRKSNGKIYKSKVRKMSYTPDFIIHQEGRKDLLIESKGFLREEGRMRFKLAQYLLLDTHVCYMIFSAKRFKQLLEELDLLKKVKNPISKI